MGAQMQGKDSKGSNDCHLRRGEMLKILPLNIPMCYARSWTLSEHCVSTIPGETYYVLQPVRMHERARANHGEDFTEGGWFVMQDARPRLLVPCTMDSFECPLLERD